MTTARTAACVGLGVIGRSWAIAFARAGWQVRLFDAQPAVADKAVAQIDRALAKLGQQDSGVRERIRPVDTLADALDGANYIQESIREDIDLKRAIFRDLDREAGPETLIGSSTSGLPGSAFMGGLDISPRCLVVHPTNPPHLVPLTELCRTLWTSDAGFAAISQIMTTIGQVPVTIHREITGFVLNRLQSAVVQEALSLVGRGIIDPIDLDKVMAFGLGLRWAFMGPFETGHLNADGGYRDYMAKYASDWEGDFRDLARDTIVDPAVVARIADALEQAKPGSVADRQLWRDRQLLAVRNAVGISLPSVIQEIDA